MPAPLRPSSTFIVMAQVTLVLGAMAILAFQPPARGRMILIPISDSVNDMASLAIDRGARLVGRGPLAGSLVVEGERERLTRGLMARGILTLAAPPAGCGESRVPNA